MLSKWWIFVAVLWSAESGSILANDLKLTPEMKAARNAKSEEIRKYINESANPCDNFFDFACGNWKTHNPINGSVPVTRSFEMALLALDDKLSELLISNDRDETIAERKLKDFYGSCLQMGTETPLTHSDDIRKTVEEFLKMPVLEGTKWDANEFDWLKTVGEISLKYDITIILGKLIWPNQVDSSTYKLILLAHKFKGHMENLDYVEFYLRYLMDVEEKNVKRSAKEIYDLNKLIKAAAADDTFTRCDTESLAELVSQYIYRVHTK